ncbi:FAD-dependent oxidoreductase [Patescibacteria group bacterium]|nr:FAD-dependent oxidoreductase [Patescibacteria group bacterium]
MYDLIIIGGGPAAVSAGIYAARKKLKTILITKAWGGQMALAPEIENYPGFELITGAELVNKFTEHLKKNELEIKEGVEIKDIKLNGNLVEVKANSDIYQAKAAVITTGRNPRKLGLANEDKFIGKGISYCSTCDAPLFRDKEVAVIGGGNMGLGTALDLATYASKIYVLEYSPELKADKYFQDKIKKIDKIEVITSVRIAEIKGNQFVNSLVYSNGTKGQNKELPVQGIFIAIGSDASSFLVKNVVKLNKEGEIKINSRNRTSQPNIFAAGDVTDISHKQIVIAAGEGAKAALNAYDYLQNLK